MKPYRCVNGRVQVDIHEMFPADAKKKLEKLLAAVGDEVEVVEVIHGYHRGSALRDMVRRVYSRHPRVLRLEVGLNLGATDLVLRD